MKTKEEIKQWLLKNCIDKKGNLDLSDLDFSDFNGNIYINRMKVKRDLWQNHQEVQRHLYQDHQEVNGNLLQTHQKVIGKLYQNNQRVDDKLMQDNRSNIIKIEIIREDSTIFTLYVNSEAEAKEFVRYFNVNISNCDEAITEEK